MNTWIRNVGAACGVTLVVAAGCGDMKTEAAGHKAGNADQQVAASAAAKEGGYATAPNASPEEAAAEGDVAATGEPIGRGKGVGPGVGLGAGAGPRPQGGGGVPLKARPPSAPNDPQARGILPYSGESAPAPTTKPQDDAPPPVTLTETVLDPNGRYATTYRPGAGHLAAFESAIAVGLIPEAEREIVSDVGARYAPTFDAPKDMGLALRSDFERTKLAPGGGTVHLRLTLRSTAEKATERPPLAVVVVLDVSGSMRGELIQSARDAASQLVDKLGDKDQFSLVTFSTEAGVRIPLTTIGPQRDGVKKNISEIVEGGGTNIGEGLKLGYAEALKPAVKKDAVKVVMLLSDGRANDGITDRKKLARFSLAAFESGIQTSSFGLGSDYDGPLMSQIANDGAGGYYYLPNAKQIAPALATELEKRLDPIATAVELRVRLKPGVELLNVYGSRRLSEEEAAKVRTIEVATDKQTEKRDKIKQNRQEDAEGGMRFFMPAFARDDSHSILLKLRLPEGVGMKDVALVAVKYKDRVRKKNVSEENVLKLEYANRDADSVASYDASVRRTVQGFAAGEALIKAAQLIADGDRQRAIDLLGEREGLLIHAAAMLGEPLFVQDASRLSRLRNHASGKDKNLRDPMVLAMMMETAGGVHLH